MVHDNDKMMTYQTMVGMRDSEKRQQVSMLQLTKVNCCRDASFLAYGYAGQIELCKKLFD